VSELRPEAKVFVRMAIFGLATGGAYWFLTYEVVGSILLVAFGGASGLGAIALQVGWPGVVPPTGSAAEPTTSHAAAESSAPEPGWAPLGVAAGVGLAAFGATFGPWLIVAGILVGIVAGVGWLSMAMREAAATDLGAEAPAPARHPDRGTARGASAGPPTRR